MQKRGATIGLRSAIIAVAILASSAAPAALVAADGKGVAAPGPAQGVAEPQAPIRISADAAEYLNKEGLVLFTGNVVAVQSDTTLTADRMDVTFEKAERTAGQPAGRLGAPAGAQRVSKIVAENKVTFRQIDSESGKERYATGEKGVYDVERQSVSMTGNPRLWEGRNVLVGDEIVFFIEEKKVIVKGKVNLVVYPDELKEEKKP